MFIIWFVLLSLIGSTAWLWSRLGRLERQLESMADGFHYPLASESLGSTEQAQAEQFRAIAEVFDPPASPASDQEPVDVVESGPWTQYAAQDEQLHSEVNEPDEPRFWGRNFGVGFEDLFGRLLPVWAGGITLAVAGMLIVKLSIDSGLLTPPIRIVSGLLFGALLIAAAELALRFEKKIRDPRVRQALAGAGISSLYASILVATNLYDLIDSFGAVLGMAGVTGLALFLSLRFGAPCALLGLVGGLAAPALVGSNEPNVPLLSLYLALTVAGLCTLSRNQRWAWLGISALVGGGGWGVLLLVGGVLDAPSSISVGLYLLLIGVGLPLLGFAGDRQIKLQIIAGVAAAAQMAALVATGGFALVNWALFGLLSIALLWLAGRHPALARLPAIGLLITLLLLGAWSAPEFGEFALVLSCAILIYGAPVAWRLWRPEGQLIDAAQFSALALGALLLPMLHFHQPDGSTDVQFGLLAFGLAMVAGAATAFGWRNARRHRDARFVLVASTAAVLLGAAAILLLPAWAIGVALAAIGLAHLQLGQSSTDPRFEPVAWVFAVLGLLAVPYDLLGVDSYGDALDSFRWALLAGISAMFAWRAKFPVGRNIAQFLAPLFLCIALSPLVPPDFEPLLPPALLLLTAWVGRRLAEERLIPALASSAMLILSWALPSLLTWSGAAAASIGGWAILVGEVPDPERAFIRLLVPGLLAAAALFVAAARLRRREQMAGLGLAVALTAVGAHSLYKQIFAIDSPEAFAAFGLAERTVWELTLAGSALIALRLGSRRAALGLAVAAVAHLGFYTLLLHNPLWAAQAVGDWPILNLLLPVYALAFAMTVVANRTLVSLPAEARRTLGIAQMSLIGLFAFSTLRQVFHGTLLVEPGLPVAEDIMRSILAIALAIGFLLWGIARRDRDWRLASLVLMLVAVAKVFLFDASGLEGLARIASFVALGFSLIMIGWLYARRLGADRLPAETAPA